MFYLIKDGKIEGSSETKFTQDGYETIEKDFTQEEIEKISAGYYYNIKTCKFTETEASLANQKRIQIESFKSLEKKATEKRAEYITAEMLPEGEFKNLKLAKLTKEGDEIKQEYKNQMNWLIGAYGYKIVEELL